MKFAPEGHRMAGATAMAGVVTLLFLGATLAAPLFALAAAILLFFRDPERSSQEGEDAILAPADGRVVVIDRESAGHRFDPEARVKVAIFMSPADVHINRLPVDGVVERVEHRPGKFSAAYSPEASEVNESNSLLVRASAGYNLVVVQIAGWLARRIVCHVDDGAQLARGDRFGLIMFGSRVDVFLPPSAVVAVREGQRTVAGETVLARIAAE